MCAMRGDTCLPSSSRSNQDYVAALIVVSCDSHQVRCAQKVAEYYPIKSSQKHCKNRPDELYHVQGGATMLEAHMA